MSSKNQPTAPSPPDPVALANAQAGANVSAANQTAQINRVNQISPYGSSIYYAPGQYRGPEAPNYPSAAPRPAGPAPAQSQAPRSPTVTAPSAGGVGGGPGAPEYSGPSGFPSAVNNVGSWLGTPSAVKAAEFFGAPVSQGMNGSAGYTGEEGSGWRTTNFNFGGSGDNPDANPSDSGMDWQNGGGQPTGLQPTGVPGIFLAPGNRVVDASGKQVHDSRYESHGIAIPGLSAQQGGMAPQGRQDIQGGGSMGPQASADPGYYGAESGFQPWTQVTTLDPADQANLDKQRGLTSSLYGLGQEQVGRINSAVSQPLDFSKLGAAPNPQDYLNPNQQVVDALYGTQTSRLNPQWDQERTRLETQLQNQGITLQTNPMAYANAFSQYNNARTDAFQQALAQAMGMGVTQSNNAFNQGMQSRQQGISELLTQHNQPINELAAILGSSPGVQTPNFGSVPGAGVNPVNTMGAAQSAYDAQQNTFNQGQANSRSNVGALAGLAGTGLQVGMGGKRTP